MENFNEVSNIILGNVLNMELKDLTVDILI